MYEAEQRRLRAARADFIEDVATAYGGCRSTEGLRAMQTFIAHLRKS
ncbi:hypothetical protein RLIN73S_06111 [Rhodanobacter lindaniclasticus]